MGQWTDLTHPLYDHMPVWPGDRPVQVEDVMTVPEDGCSVQRIVMGNHVGTHVDAPAHFVSTGLTVDALPLRILNGPARLVSVPRAEKQVITREDLEAVLALKQTCKRLILHTGWHTRFSSAAFYQDFPVLTLEAAEYLAGMGIVLLGMDTPSPSPIHDPGQQIHKVLLGAGVVLVESMANLSALPPGDFEVCVLPLPLGKASGSPCRAIGRSCGH
ncbi:MAG: cyclase family protein [Desulfovermiculus sp.]|nr:cyclase family protein [Desulfovermiculus sp.]